MPIIISRVGYCPRCAERARPHTGDIFLVHGTSSGSYQVRIAQDIGYYGFTPHIYKIIKIKAEKRIVIVDVACGMYGCGVDKKMADYDDSTDFYFVKRECWHRQTFSFNRWNSLVYYKRDLQYTV